MDIRHDITTAIIDLIAQGAATDDACLWDAAGRFGMPTNYRTQCEYSGVNVLLLLAAAHARGLERNEWPYRLNAARGAIVRMGFSGPDA